MSCPYRPNILKRCTKELSAPGLSTIHIPHDLPPFQYNPEDHTITSPESTKPKKPTSRESSATTSNTEYVPPTRRRSLRKSSSSNSGIENPKKVKRQRKISPTTQNKKSSLDLSDIADIEFNLQSKPPASKISHEPKSDMKNVGKPNYSDVEFLEDELWDVGYFEENDLETPLEQYNPKTICDNFDWQPIKQKRNPGIMRREHFKAPKVGPVEDFATPYEAFKAIWDDDIIKLIVNATNKSGIKEFRKNNIKKNKESKEVKRKTWRNLTENEIHVFIAILLTTGLCKKVMIDDYISNHNTITGTPNYSKHMSAIRFRTIKQYFRFVDFKLTSQENQNLTPFEQKMVNIKPLLTALNDNIKSLYNLSQNIVIEKVHSVRKTNREVERTICVFDSNSGYCGQIGFALDDFPKAVRIKELSKTIVEPEAFLPSLEENNESESISESVNLKQGLKTNLSPKNRKKSVNDSKKVLTSRELYATNTYERTFESTTENPISKPVIVTILNMIEHLKFRGHTIYMDHCFQSPPLARQLKALGFDCIGSLNPKQDFLPEALKHILKDHEDMLPGQVVGFTCGDVDLILWNDRKPFTLISTFHGLSTIQRSCLLVAVDYNFNMTVTDRVKKLTKYLPLKITSAFREETGFRSYFKFLLNITVMNAYILYQHSLNSEEMDIEKFLDVLVQSILLKHSKGAVIESTKVISSKLSDHIPVKSGQIQMLPCAICSKPTEFLCLGCEEFMCFVTNKNCHVTFHENVASIIEKQISK